MFPRRFGSDLHAIDDGRGLCRPILNDVLLICPNPYNCRCSWGRAEALDLLARPAYFLPGFLNFGLLHCYSNRDNAIFRR
jgi:hypothetical protein